MAAQRLVIFTRFPEPHMAKTRLIPALGPEGAAQLQSDMTRHTLAEVRELAAGCPLSVEVRFEGGDAWSSRVKRVLVLNCRIIIERHGTRGG